MESWKTDMWALYHKEIFKMGRGTGVGKLKNQQMAPRDDDRETNRFMDRWKTIRWTPRQKE